MKATIKKLKLSYFKGIKSLEMKFDEDQNFLHGKNASGKTTVFDAVWFLFFGKDSTGRADFNIKTLDTDNNAIEKVDHEVHGEFEIDGNKKTFTRTYKQLWSKEGVLKGHTTDYQIDGYPVRLESDYKKQVEEYFKEDLFKLLTNPLFFNSMKPGDRRQVIIGTADTLTYREVLASLPAKLRSTKQMTKLGNLLTEANMIQIKAKIAYDKKNLKDEVSSIPDRIDEANRSKPEDYNYEELAEIIAEKKKDLKDVEAKIEEANFLSTAKNKAIQQHQTKVFEKKGQLQKMKFEAEHKLREWKNEQERHPKEVQAKIKELGLKAKNVEYLIGEDQREINRLQEEVRERQEAISSMEEKKADLVEAWKQINSKEFEWNGTTCPACERPLEGVQALSAEEEARERFNKAKTEELKEVERQGNNLKMRIQGNKEENQRLNDKSLRRKEAMQMREVTLQSTKDDLITLESSINEWYSNPQEEKELKDFLPAEAKDIQSQIEKLEATAPEEIKADTSGLKEEKAAMEAALENLQKAIGNKDTIDRINTRIEELKTKEKELYQAITDLEGLEEAAFTLSKARVEMIEEQINSQFELVEFKLFETLLIGTEKEICETLMNGVPFNDLNNAGKIQAGLDIIKGLSKFNNMYLPIFIDNRESVTWIPEVESQIINLVVDPTAEKLELKKEKQLQLI